MKEKWLMARGPWEEVKPRITTALESGFDCVLVDQENVPKVRELGKIRVASFGEIKGEEDIMVVGLGGEGDGSLPIPDGPGGSRDAIKAASIPAGSAAYVVISGKRAEQFAVEMGRLVDYLIVIGTDWKVIPLENIIAGLEGLAVRIIMGIKSAGEAGLALSTLEKGAAGVLLDSVDPSEIKRVMEAVEQSERGRVELIPARITTVRAVGMGDRVCVDTASMMTFGEGMLIGSQARGFFLVHSESEESPYVASRPFRVNAGAVHAYIRVGEKTRYLSELKSGDEVTIVSKGGLARAAIVGRAKIEKRPMMLIEADASGRSISTLLQNAETIKLVSPDGTPKAVTDLKVGDEVLVHLEKSARHFGMKIEESIVEQ